jgi:hypothetical protein
MMSHGLVSLVLHFALSTLLPYLLSFTAVWHLWHPCSRDVHGGDSYELDGGSLGQRRYQIGPIKNFKVVKLPEKSSKRLYVYYYIKSLFTRFDKATEVHGTTTRRYISQLLNEVYATAVVTFSTLRCDTYRPDDDCEPAYLCVRHYFDDGTTRTKQGMDSDSNL